MRTPVWRVAVIMLVLFIGVLAFAGYALFGNRRVAPLPVERATNGARSLTARAGSTDGAQTIPAPKPSTVARAPTKLRPDDASASLLAARDSLARSDLSGAKAALADVVAIEPGNADARSVKQDIALREQRRDAALADAKGCEKNARWDCMRHRASDALAADTSSVEAKTLLERALVATGWRTPPSLAANAPRDASMSAPRDAPRDAPMNAPMNASMNASTNASMNAPSQTFQAATSVYVPPADITGARERAIRDYGWRPLPPGEIANTTTGKPAIASTPVAAH